jgi:uncharacterized damage-inducible protein DinB
MAKSQYVPQLETPGSGLPPLELLIGKVGFALYRSMSSRQGATARFKSESQQLISLATSVSEEVGKQRVLIKRITGIEDSSRFWSVFMVLDHLVIVDKLTIKIMENLSMEKKFSQKIRIEDIKPQPERGKEVIDEFQALIGDYVSCLEEITDWRLKQYHTHPWFGPLNVYGWHCFATLHHFIHRRQLHRIIQTLSVSH